MCQGESVVKPVKARDVILKLVESLHSTKPLMEDEPLRISMVSIDWKESWNDPASKIKVSQSKKLIGHPCYVYHIHQNESDDKVVLISSLPLTKDEIMAVWENGGLGVEDFPVWSGKDIDDVLRKIADHSWMTTQNDNDDEEEALIELGRKFPPGSIYKNKNGKMFRIIRYNTEDVPPTATIHNLETGETILAGVGCNFEQLDNF